LLAVAGCGGDNLGKVVPVSGKVTLDGTPLKSAVVTFVPDAAKGNKTKAGVFAMVDENGHYSLQSTPEKGSPRDGAPLGWYKVKVMPGMSMNMGTGGETAKVLDPTKVKSKKDASGTPYDLGQIPTKYRDEKTTTLSIEVVESPAAGAYDLKLTK